MNVERRKCKVKEKVKLPYWHFFFISSRAVNKPFIK